MNDSFPTCPYCDLPTRLVRAPTRVRRGERVLAVPLAFFECTGVCRSEDGVRPFGFINQPLAASNDAEIRLAWEAAFGEPLPTRGRPGRKPPEPRDRTIQVRLSESEMREIDRLRGGMTRSEYIRANALHPHKRSA